VQVRRQPADVRAVAHRVQRQHRDQRVLRGVQRTERVGHAPQLEAPRHTARLVERFARKIDG
jgi:hypothetical protein